MLEKVTVVDKIEINPETGYVSVRHATFVTDDGVPISAPNYARTTLEPGESRVADFPDVVKDHVAVAWTPAVITRHQARRAEQERQFAERLDAGAPAGRSSAGRSRA